jgi:hypothetical protein
MDNHPQLYSSLKELLPDGDSLRPVVAPGVSEVIPLYNRASFVGRSLRSVFKQSKGGWLTLPRWGIVGRIRL